MNKLCLLCGVLLVVFTACKSGPFNLIKPASPHEQYQRKLENAGLAQTAMGRAWIERASQSLQNPLSISLPYSEQGYFGTEKAGAAAFSFSLQRGQKLQVKLSTKPGSARIFMDVWQQEANSPPKLLASADTAANSLQSDIDFTGTHILRLQPELLAGGSYTLEITTGPSLDYPLRSYSPTQIRSFWGDGRDAGARSHEGIDIFAPFRTPVLAVAPGTVTRVNENNLGGRVVWFRPEGKNYTLYYAHLDEQSVTDGQQVSVGDTLGLMGNTGNAQSTPPHLHFGIYTIGGAIDPLPFIDPRIKNPAPISVSAERINASLRTSTPARLTAGSGVTELARGTVFRVTAASAGNYRVELPDGREGFVSGKSVSPITEPLSSYTVRQGLAEVYDRPDSNAAVKVRLRTGQRVQVRGSFGNYRLITYEAGSGWIIPD